MTLSPSKAAYEDCFELLDRALRTKIGIRIDTPDAGSANHLCSRLNYARTLSRQESREVYEPDHAEFGISAYDGLIVRRPRQLDGKWWIYIEPRRVVGTVEELAAE